jgi:hypothetical protein
VLSETGSKPLRKLARSQARSWVARHLQVVQNNLCPLCGEFIDLRVKGEGIIDHDHDTGEIRGVLHRSCNAAEGKISNAAARWGCKSSSYADIVAYLEAVVAYLKGAGTGLMYFAHKTLDEKKDARNAAARERRALIKAKVAMRSRKES